MMVATGRTSGHLLHLHNMIHIAHCCTRQVIRLGWIAFLVLGAAKAVLSHIAVVSGGVW